MSKTYSRQIEKLTTRINEVAKFVPQRRKRKLHIGLFGYTRAVAGRRLPRAIGFCASFYSMGLPPELLGLSGLKSSDINIITDHYPNFMHDLKEAMLYYDPQCLKILPPMVADEIQRTVRMLKIDVEPDLIHQSLVRAIRNLLVKNNSNNITELITQAAVERRFLG
jgi:phosphoenolpyruvate carboxylase